MVVVVVVVEPPWKSEIVSKKRMKSLKKKSTQDFLLVLTFLCSLVLLFSFLGFLSLFDLPRFPSGKKTRPKICRRQKVKFFVGFLVVHVRVKTWSSGARPDVETWALIWKSPNLAHVLCIHSGSWLGALSPTWTCNSVSFLEYPTIYPCFLLIWQTSPCREHLIEFIWSSAHFFNYILSNWIIINKQHGVIQKLPVSILPIT